MYDMLAALNAALIPMSMIFMGHFALYQYSRRKEEQATSLSIFGWSIFCLSVAIFVSSVLYLLWDYDVIYKSTQYKLSVIPRCFYILGLALAFHALELRWRMVISITAAFLVMSVFTLRVIL